MEQTGKGHIKSAICGILGDISNHLLDPYKSIKKNHHTFLLMISFLFRNPDSWTPEPSLNLERAFGFFAYLPDTMCKKMKLFIFGGLDPSTSKPVLETETFDEEEGIWTIHKSLHLVENNVFQKGADSGFSYVLGWSNL